MHPNDAGSYPDNFILTTKMFRLRLPHYFWEIGPPERVHIKKSLFTFVWMLITVSYCEFLTSQLGIITDMIKNRGYSVDNSLWQEDSKIAQN